MCIFMTNTKIELFEELCKAHDITYSYSDDHSAWQKGHDEYAKIMELSEDIPQYIAMTIWNRCVFEKLSEDFIEEFLWK